MGKKIIHIGYMERMRSIEKDKVNNKKIISKRLEAEGKDVTAIRKSSSPKKKRRRGCGCSRKLNR